MFSVDTQVVAVAPHNSVEPKREGLQWFVRDATSGSVTVTLESTKQSVYIVGCSNTHVMVWIGFALVFGCLNDSVFDSQISGKGSLVTIEKCSNTSGAEMYSALRIQLICCCSGPG